MSRDIVCLGFQKEFPTINLKMKNEDEKKFEYSILLLLTLETGRGFKVKKIGKTTKKGTKVEYVAFKSNDDVESYRKLLQDRVKEFNEKWEDNIKLA